MERKTEESKVIPISALVKYEMNSLDENIELLIQEIEKAISLIREIKGII